MPVSGVKIAPCLLALAAACLPLCLWWGDGPVHSRLAVLWCLVNPLFCEWASLRLRLEPFARKSSLFFFFFSFSLSLAIPQFGLVAHVSSLRLSSGHSGPVLTLSNIAHTSLSSPCLPVVDKRVWATSPLGVVVRHIFCGLFFFFFPSWLCCPLRFQNSPETCRWGFPGVWKVLLLHNSLPRTGLHP